MVDRFKPWITWLTALLLFTGCASPEKRAQRQASERVQSLRNTFGTYDAEPRTPDGRVDVDRLVSELTSIQANTYNFLVWRASTDWDDFKRFLTRIRGKKIRVWVTLVPPSESPPHTGKYSEPFQLDYQRWAIEIAKLSLQEPNLVAWSLDDFSYDSATFTPDYLGKMVDGAHAVNPRLAFVPCLYYDHITPQLAERYGPHIDGVLFPYRHESHKRNLSQWDTLEAEINRVKSRFGTNTPVFVDVYATKHSQLSDSSAEYVKEVMKLARKHADGVLIYCHQYEATSPEKYQVIKQLFHEWASETTKVSTAEIAR